MAFFDLIQYLVDHSRLDSLAGTLAAGIWGLPFNKSLEVIRLLKKNDVSELGKHLPALIVIRKQMQNDGALPGLIHVAEESGFTALVSSDPSYVHVWRGIVTLAQSLAREGDIQNLMELMKLMLDYRQSAELKPVKVSVGAPDFKIKAMTAHGSKGLEFDYVFIPYANEEFWINRSRGSSFILPEKNYSDYNVKDMRRLFYVAVTRAKKHAVILYALEEPDGKVMTPLRFIDELKEKETNKKVLPRTNISFKSVSGGDKKDHQILLVNEAKKILTETGLSVTALNHYLECPSKFLYESILKLPQAPSVMAEKGSAMHYAISKIWQLNKKTLGAEKIEKCIAESATEYVNKSFLSLSDREALENELSKNAPAVATSLLPHWKSKGNISSERWVEVPFDSEFEKERISINLHGKLDTIIDTGPQVSVFDYKTKQAMSEAAIKGETRNDDGNYFRQLVFYNILLETSHWRGKKIQTSLVFVSPDNKGRCPIVSLPVGAEDVKRVKDEIGALVKAIWSGEITEQYCDDPACRYCGYRRLLK